jgi:teichuronic acid biosynthesis glycosyltransferase TuaC
MNKDLIDDRFGRFREIPLALAQKGHIVNGLCLSYTKRDEGQLKDGPVFWQSINATRIKVPGLLKFFFEAFKLAKRTDVIWACSDSFYGAIGCVLSRICKRPVVFDIYDNFGSFFVAKLPIAKQLYHWAIRRSDAITCLSKPFAEYLMNRWNRKNHVHPIEFAVAPELFRAMDKSMCRKIFDFPQDALLVGTAGMLSKQREVHLLIDTFSMLKENYADLHLVLAGPLGQNIRIPDDARIHYVGILPFEKVPFFINTLDVAVVCYADDEFGKYCFPQKTREMMACDVPVIAAKVGGLMELFKDHPEWLYDPGNSESLANVLRNRFLDRKTNYAPSPSWPELAGKLENVILDLTNK